MIFGIVGLIKACAMRAALLAPQLEVLEKYENSSQSEGQGQMFPLSFDVYRVTMTSFGITICGQCCRLHVVGQQVVSDISVIRSCWGYL